MLSPFVRFDRILLHRVVLGVIVLFIPIGAVIQSIPLSLSPDGLHYTIPLFFGNAAQPIQLIIDTGSSEIYLFDCTNEPRDCYSLSPSAVLRSSTNTYSLTVDGELLVDNQLSTVVDKVSFFLNQIQEPNNVAYLGSRFMEVKSNSVQLHKFTTSAGIIGLGLEELSTLSCKSRGGILCTAFLQILSTYSPNTIMFALDFGWNGSSSFLHLGGVGPAYNSLIEEIEWAQQTTAIYRAFYQVTIYDMSICGVSMFAGLTNVWNAIIDTGSSCLGLPAEFFDMLISWIPVECIEGKNSFGLDSPVCYIRPDLSSSANWNRVRSELPVIEFRVSRDGRVFYLPIANLVLPISPTETQRRICIMKHRAFSEKSVADFTKTITFGTRAITAFHTIFDVSNSRVGFLPSFTTEVNENDKDKLCNVRTACQSYQTLDEKTNVCKDPDCKQSYFYVFDTSSESCKLSPIYVSLLCLGIGCLALSEFVIQSSFSSKISKLVYFSE